MFDLANDPVIASKPVANHDRVERVRLAARLEPVRREPLDSARNEDRPA